MFRPLIPAFVLLAGVALTAQRPAPAADADPVKVLPLRGNVHMLVTPAGNVVLQTEPATRPPRIPGTYIGGYGVLLVDTGPAEMATSIRAAVRRISQGPIRYILATHGHPDHVGALQALSAGSPGGRGGAAATVLGHENLLLQMAEVDPPLPPAAMPTDGYLDLKELFFNGESVQVFHVPSAHTDGDGIVYFRRSDVIAAGDIFQTMTYPVIDTARGGSIQGVIDGLNQILDLAVPESNAEGGTLIVPGHGRLADEGDVVEYRNMNVIIRDRIEALVKKGMTLEQVKAARPTLDYDFRYGRTTGPWTTDMFIKAVYDEMSTKVAPPRPVGRQRPRT